MDRAGARPIAPVKPTEPVASPAQLIAQAQSGRADVPRMELAARLKAAGLDMTSDYAPMRDNAARELAGRPDGVGPVSAAERAGAAAANERQIAVLQDTARPPPTLAEIARLAGRPHATPSQPGTSTPATGSTTKTRAIARAATWRRRRGSSATCRVACDRSPDAIQDRRSGIRTISAHARLPGRVKTPALSCSRHADSMPLARR
jgi:hypothetical protein